MQLNSGLYLYGACIEVAHSGAIWTTKVSKERGFHVLVFIMMLVTPFMTDRFNLFSSFASRPDPCLKLQVIMNN